jgi:hypothetical protein
MVIFDLYPINKNTPKTTSKMTKNKANARVYGTKKGMLKTFSPKYSLSLYEKPTGSLSLIKPEMIKSTPTKILENWVTMFLILFFLQN